MSQYNRMLVAAPERWDDACFAVPAIRALATSGLQIGVMCGKPQVDFWKSLAGIEVVDDGSPPGPGRWDAALAWEYGAIAKAIRKSGIARRIAPARDRKLAKWATDPADAAVHVLEHRVRHFLATVEALGVRTDDKTFFAPVEGGGDQCDDHQPPPRNRVLVCADSDSGPSHEWPLERWADLARWLGNECGTRLAVIALAGGRDLGARLAAELGDGVEMLAAGSIGDAIPHLKNSRILISADGSLPHLASHFGATCAVIFGPNDAAWRRPLGRHHVIVRRHVECSPCLMAKCPLDHRCMSRLEVAQAKDALRPMLKNR